MTVTVTTFVLGFGISTLFGFAVAALMVASADKDGDDDGKGP